MTASKTLLNTAVQRIIDVNINRLTEALKVIEDIIRFGLESKILLRNIRSLRVKIGKEVVPLRREVIGSRGSERDLGRGDRFDRLKRRNMEEVLMANFKRAEESARVLEELFKMGEMRKRGRRKDWAGRFKEVRFRLYDLEQRAVTLFQRKGIDLKEGESILPKEM